jgi:hypothetical protein
MSFSLKVRLMNQNNHCDGSLAHTSMCQYPLSDEWGSFEKLQQSLTMQENYPFMTHAKIAHKKEPAGLERPAGLILNQSMILRLIRDQIRRATA